MATKLRKLKINRVDLVGKGANQEAHVLLFKHDDGEIIDAEDEHTDHLDRSVDSATLPDKSLDVEDVDMPPDAQNEALDALKAEIESLKSTNETLAKELSDAKADIAKRDDKHAEEDIWKGVSPALKRMFEEQKKETEIAKAAAQYERDERIRRECIAKGEAYEFLPVNPTNDWEVFKAIDGLDDTVSDRIYELFRAGDTNLKKAGLPNERGVRGGDNEGIDPYEEIERLISEKMSKSANGLNYLDASSQVMREHPHLYKSYTNHSKAQVGKGE